tara:strand:+ start:1164 stop:1592 length:429 start_codon:yes stop_codon:yes gene_type:complete
MFSFIGQKKRKIKEQEENIKELMKEAFEMKNNAYKKGMHLLDQPFIPEYLGFKEFLNKDKDQMLVGRIYNKGTLNVSKPQGSDEWYILDSKKDINLVLKIDNIFHAIVLFESLSFPGFSIEKFLKNSMEESILLEKQLSSQS